MSINHRDFLNNIVKANMQEFRANHNDLRRAYNAIASIDALSAHIFHHGQSHNIAEIAAYKDDSAYRQGLSERNLQFALIRDAAKAQKHVNLTRGDPKVSKTSQVKSRPLNGFFGSDYFASSYWAGLSRPSITINTDDGGKHGALSVAEDALSFLEQEIARLGI